MCTECQKAIQSELNKDLININLIQYIVTVKLSDLGMSCRINRFTESASVQHKQMLLLMLIITNTRL